MTVETTKNALLDNFCGLLSKPTDLSWNNMPFGVFRGKDHKAFTTFEPKMYDVERAVVRYVHGISGSDAADGLTPSTAWRTIEYALQTLITLNPASASIILLSNSRYLNGFGNKTVTFPLTIKASSGIATIAHSYGYQFTLSSGSTYKKSGVGSTGAIDFKHRDVYGCPLRLTAVTSIAEVDSTPNSCFNDGSYLYIRLLDSRVPDDFVFAQSNTYILNAQSDLYLENINVATGYNSIYCNATSVVTHVYNNCGFYGAKSKGVNFNPTSVGSTLLMKSCKTMIAGADGNSFHGASKTLEDCCLVVGCGGENDNDNNSTAHDGSMCVRVSSTYVSGLGTVRNVNDTGVGTVSWNVGCFADVGLAAGDPIGSPAWAAGDSTMILDDCYASGESYWFRVDGSGHMKFRSFIPKNGTKYGSEKMSTY